MKRIIAGILLLLMVFTVVGCSSEPKTVEEACEKADSMVKEWDKKTKKLCSYTAEFSEQQGVKIYLVKAQSLTVADETDFAKEHNARTVTEFVYKELKEVFENFPEVAIGVAMLNESGNAYYLTSDGEVLYNSYE